MIERFRARDSPVASIADYLRGVLAEATRRSYEFAAHKIDPARSTVTIAVTRGQIEYECCHLIAKLAIRSSELHAQLEQVRQPELHPVFRIVPGDVEAWERGADPPFTPVSRRSSQSR